MRFCSRCVMAAWRAGAHRLNWYTRIGNTTQAADYKHTELVTLDHNLGRIPAKAFKSLLVSHGQEFPQAGVTGALCFVSRDWGGCVGVQGVNDEQSPAAGVQEAAEPQILMFALYSYTYYMRPRRKPLNRRFIVVEGIYAHTGELAPLADIYALKQKYKCGAPPQLSFKQEWTCQDKAACTPVL